MISNAVFNFSVSLVFIYAIALGMILAKLLNSFRAKRHFHRFQWLPSYIGLLVMFCSYILLLIFVTCKLTNPLESAVLSGFVGPLCVCIYFTFLSRYAGEPKTNIYFYLIFGTASLVGLIDVLALVSTGKSFVLASSSEFPSTFVLKFYGSKNELKPIGMVLYGIVFIASLYFGIKYFVKFLTKIPTEKLLLCGIGCNIVFQLNDMLTTVDLFPLIPIFGMAIIPEIFHVDAVLSKAVSSEKNELSMQLENQKLIAFHQSRLAAIGEISSSIGHEISNPLAISDSIIFRLKRHLKNLQLEDETTNEYFEKYSIATKRIANIISGLRSLSSSDTVEKEKFDVIKSTRETIDFAKEFYKSQGVDLVYQSNLTSVFVLGFTVRIQQCLLNLITNAKDALDKRVSDKKITVTVREESGNVTISVHDNGCGIPEENQHKIFEPYFSTKEKKRGTGLGLALVQYIVEQEHGGKTSFKTSTEGTIFSIELPLAKSVV